MKSVQRKYTRLIFNLCNISYTSYLGRLTKLKIKSLEYWILEFDLITFLKLVNDETTINMQPFLNFRKLITYTEERAKNLYADIILIMRFCIDFFYRSVQTNFKMN